MTDRKNLLPRLCLVFCAVLTLFLCWRWQRIFYLMCADYIRSDMPDHIRLALGHNDYGLASVFVRSLWAAFGEARGQTALSLLLAANQLFGLFTVWLLLRRMFPALDGRFAYLAALLAHLCGPWILPGQTGMYLGVFNGNLYHNMTLLFSRSFVPLDLLLFFRLWDAKRVKLSARDWIAFALCLLITTLFKPSFLGAFAPAVFCLLVFDFVRTRARGVKNEFLIGLAFIPSLAALLWASSVLYAEDFAGTSTGVALRALTPAMLFSLAVMYLRGSLLPLWSFSLQGPREHEQREHLGIFVFVLAAAILEAVLLTETGYRATHGNFLWGSFTLYPSLFALAIALLWRMLPGLREKGAPRLRAIVGVVLLLGHLVTGVYCLHMPGNAGYDWFYF